MNNKPHHHPTATARFELGETHTGYILRQYNNGQITLMYTTNPPLKKQLYPTAMLTLGTTQ